MIRDSETVLRSVPWPAIAAVLAVIVVAGCTTTANPYPTGGRGGGWENFRADAAPPVLLPAKRA